MWYPERYHAKWFQWLEESPSFYCYVLSQYTYRWKISDKFRYCRHSLLFSSMWVTTTFFELALWGYPLPPTSPSQVWWVSDITEAKTELYHSGDVILGWKPCNENPNLRKSTHALSVLPKRNSHFQACRWVPLTILYLLLHWNQIMTINMEKSFYSVQFFKCLIRYWNLCLIDLACLFAESSGLWEYGHGNDDTVCFPHLPYTTLTVIVTTK